MKKFINGNHRFQHNYEVMKLTLLENKGRCRVIEGEMLRAGEAIYRSSYNGFKENVTAAYIFLDKTMPHIRDYIEPLKPFIFTYDESFDITPFEQALEDMIECILQMLSDRKDSLTISDMDMMFFDVDRTNEHLFYKDFYGKTVNS